MKARDLVESDAQWVIGNGRTVRIFKDNCILGTQSPPIQRAEGTIDEDAVVADLIFHDTRLWDIERIMASFNSFIVKRILNIPISFRLPDDKVTWKWEKSGEFSVRSGHHLLCENKSKEVVESSSVRGTDIWKQIWNFNGPRSVHNFLWRLASNILPTRCNLSKKGISLDQTCPLCNYGMEDSNHLFLHCPAAKAVWFSSPLGIHIPPNSVCREWMEHWLRKDDPLAVQVFDITLWRLCREGTN